MNQMNPSSAMARVLIDELIRGGVEEFVVAPGSRNAPLSMAVAAEAARGRARLHVRIDERSAGFLALGLARGSGRTAAVITTSGTATANLHPAVLEASHSDVPLLILTADRPPELRGTGANQTTDQQHLFGSSVRHYAEIGPAEPVVGQVRYWRSAVARAVHASASGPVHLNIPLREPLVGDVGEWIEPLDGREGDLPWTMVVDQLPHTFDIGLDLPPRGAVVVAHDPVGITPSAVEAFAAALGWPLVTENPISFATSVAHSSLFLADEQVRHTLTPDAVVVIGRPVLSRSISAWLSLSPRTIVIDPSHTWSDPARRADVVLPDLPLVEDDRVIDAAWLPLWAQHAKRAAAVIANLPEWSEGRVVARIGELLPMPSTVVVGASRPIRDFEGFSTGRGGISVFANRGLAGIDGTVSTAIGIALTSPDPTFAVLGDLTFLHDLNGLLINDHQPSITFLVIDNNGGGIFSTLPQAGSEHFEMVFGTPHHRDLVALAKAFGVDAHRVRSGEELEAHLKVETIGIRVLVLDLPSRAENAALLHRLAGELAG